MHQGMCCAATFFHILMANEFAKAREGRDVMMQRVLCSTSFFFILFFVIHTFVIQTVWRLVWSWKQPPEKPRGVFCANCLWEMLSGPQESQHWLPVKADSKSDGLSAACGLSTGLYPHFHTTSFNICSPHEHSLEKFQMHQGARTLFSLYNNVHAAAFKWVAPR